MDRAKPSGLSVPQARNGGLMAISIAFVYGKSWDESVLLTDLKASEREVV